MICSFSARDNHPRDKKVIDWYKGVYKSERSRKIVEILYAHIVGSEHRIESEIGKSLETPKVEMKMIDIGGKEEVDLESKLDMFGGGYE